MTMYKLSGVTKDYLKGRDTVHALRGVDLVIEDRDWLSIQGPTGHGKSTLLQILGGLDRPTAGVVDFDGQDLAQMREVNLTQVRAASIGFVFQTFNLIPTLSAQENVETALVPLGIHGHDRKARALKALADVGLDDRARHVPSELSGGQQQRVALARALVKEPKVLLADEPTGNLDEDTRDEIMNLLEKFWLEYGLTLVVVTHDSTVAKRAQRIGTMRNGRLTLKSTGRRAPGPAQAAAAPRTEAAKAAAAKLAEAKAAAEAAEAAAATARAAAEAAEAEAADADSAELSEDAGPSVNA
ncbi:MAG TPA: ABC transporter ATP-binding protein [Streptosporangiaceae bacterium]|nr:ABC transporter ATP-binding protein [Streptosporangiaceae bacterium]